MLLTAIVYAPAGNSPVNVVPVLVAYVYCIRFSLLVIIISVLWLIVVPLLSLYMFIVMLFAVAVVMFNVWYVAVLALYTIVCVAYPGLCSVMLW